MMRLLCALMFVTAVLSGQEDANVGTLHGNTYTNSSIGLRLEVPSGWKALPVSEGGPGVYLRIQRVSDPQTQVIFRWVGFDGTPTISADRSKSYAEKFADEHEASITREAVRIVVGGIDMYRTDLKQDEGTQPFIALLTVAIRDSIRIFEVRGDAQRELDPAVRMLATSVHFVPDYEASGIKSNSATPVTLDAAQSPAALPDTVAKPEYPPDAKAAGISGTVTFNLEISDKGVPVRIWQVEESPNLADPTSEAAKYQALFRTAALEQVRKLRFHPLKQNGKGISAYVHYTVSFALQ